MGAHGVRTIPSGAAAAHGGYYSCGVPLTWRRIRCSGNYATLVLARSRGSLEAHCGNRACAPFACAESLCRVLLRKSLLDFVRGGIDREILARALRSRPSESDSLSIVDYLYLAQLPNLLFASETWKFLRENLGGPPDVKQRLQSAIAQIAPVRNEIAHIREVEPNRLLKASAACAEVCEIVRGLAPQ
jgi:hypothetical protein